MFIKRSTFLLFTIWMIMIALLFRIYYINFSPIKNEVETTAGVRRVKRLLYSSRGIIYDRNLAPLAGNQLAYYMVIDPRNFSRDNLEYLFEISIESQAKISDNLKKETPFVLKSYIKPKEMKGVSIYEGTTRYPLESVSRHIVGYLDSEGTVGLSGIEKSYDNLLAQFKAETKFEYSTNALNGMRDNEISFEGCVDSKNGIVLTIDKNLTKFIEDTLCNSIECGCAVVMDCNSGEILSLVSVPGFDAENLGDYMDSDKGELINRTLVNQTVGSVFKIVVSASALCNGVGDFTYECSGATTVNGRVFTCQNSTAHGEQNLSEAFANSCNCYFISLGQLLGTEGISETFENFGLDGSLRIAKDIYSESATFPASSGSLALANLSIGQGDLMMTPLSVARLTAIACNGGYLVNPNIYSAIYKDGKKICEKEYNYKSRVLSDDVANKLKEMCVMCVQNGTGRAAIPNEGGAGGKTASAQTGRFKESGKEILNTYFTGFYPADKPEYVITVFASDGKSGSSTCAPVFKQICDFISQNY